MKKKWYVFLLVFATIALFYVVVQNAIHVSEGVKTFNAIKTQGFVDSEQSLKTHLLLDGIELILSILVELILILFTALSISRVRLMLTQEEKSAFKKEREERSRRKMEQKILQLNEKIEKLTNRDDD